MLKRHAKKRVKIAIIAGICAVVIIGGVALFVHVKLSEIEKNETQKESAEQVAKEATDVLSGKPHSEANEVAETDTKTNESTESATNDANSTQSETREQNVNATESSSEENESAEQRAAESP